MQAFAAGSGSAFFRTTGCTQQSLASTSPRCGATVAVPTLNCSTHPRPHLFPRQRSTANLHGRHVAALVSFAPVASESDVGEGSVSELDPAQDPDAAVAAAEVGGRNYLQLSDTSDASLQVRMVQWYPGHIARAERQLKSQLSMVDVVLEVRDARILVSTHHPQVADWVGAKPRLLIINRADEVAPQDLVAWKQHFEATGAKVFWTDGRSGDGVKGVRRELLKEAAGLNAKRAKRGLKPRAVRACVIGFPNIGKSALINRLVKRRAVESAPKPGVTRALRWVRVDEQLDLLDAPGVIPASFRDQLAAQRLAICNDIGEAAYLASAVGAALVLRVKQLAAAEAEAAARAAESRQAKDAGAGGAAAAEEAGQPEVAPGKRAGTEGARPGGNKGGGDGSSGGGGGGAVMTGVLERIRQRYGVDPLTVGSVEDFVVALADLKYGGDVERSGLRVLTDYRSGALGRFALELPREVARRERREEGLQAAADRLVREREGAAAGRSADARSAKGSPLGSGEEASQLGYDKDDLGPDGAVGGSGGWASPGNGRFGQTNSSWVEAAEAWDEARAQAGTGDSRD